MRRNLARVVIVLLSFKMSYADNKQHEKHPANVTVEIVVDDTSQPNRTPISYTPNEGSPPSCASPTFQNVVFSMATSVPDGTRGANCAQVARWIGEPAGLQGSFLIPQKKDLEGMSSADVKALQPKICGAEKTCVFKTPIATVEKNQTLSVAKGGTTIAQTFPQVLKISFANADLDGNCDPQTVPHSNMKDALKKGASAILADLEDVQTGGPCSPQMAGGDPFSYCLPTTDKENREKLEQKSREINELGQCYMSARHAGYQYARAQLCEGSTPKTFCPPRT